MAGLISFFAALAGLAGFKGDWNGPIAVELRGGPFFVEHAWIYLIPVIVLAAVSTVALFGTLIALVLRDGQQT
jgi:hypothetical protein